MQTVAGVLEVDFSSLSVCLSVFLSVREFSYKASVEQYYNLVQLKNQNLQPFNFIDIFFK